MNIEELRIQRRQLEMELAILIAQKLTAFRDHTGLSIRAIHVDLINVQAMGEREADYILSAVRCELAI